MDTATARQPYRATPTGPSMLTTFPSQTQTQTHGRNTQSNGQQRVTFQASKLNIRALLALFDSTSVGFESPVDLLH